MNQSEKVNPYASPEALPGDSAIEARKKALKWLRVAGAGILILAAMEITAAIAAICMLLVMLSLSAIPGTRAEPLRWVDLFAACVSSLLLIRGVLMVIGARNMRSGKNLQRAKVGAIAAIAGVIYPLLWLDVGFGIWAFVLLRREKYRKLFEMAPPRKGETIPMAEVAGG